MMDQKTNSIVSELHDEIYGLRCDIGRLEQEKDQCETTIEYLRRDCVDWEDKYLAVSIENAKLREFCSELLRMAESNDPDFLHWPEIHDELREMGIEV